MSSPIAIQDYDPLWPQRFETLRSRIDAVLAGFTSAIEHVGSTAVPGLAAKPIIDIDILLISATDLSLVISKLASLRYQHQGDRGVPSREAFRPSPDDFPHHLYVCPPDSQEYRRHIAFRDYLRTHPRDANAYADLKRKLANQFGPDREGYTQAKSEFVAEVLRHTGQDFTR